MTAWVGAARTMDASRRVMLVVALAGLLLAQIGQPYPQVAVLHHVPTLGFLLAVPLVFQRWEISNRSLLCLLAFLALHTIGGRYTYTNTPYDAWFEAIFGQGLSAVMGWERNHYDRLVHFAFGLLMVLPVADLLRRNAAVSRRLALYIGVEFVLAIRAV